MNLDQIETKCFILALFIRDDGERFLLGSRAYEFVDSQLHFVANSYQNDIVEVQGNDGVMLAGQVRRGTSQAFDGYIGDQTVDRSTIEQYRRDFMKFFRKNHYYKVVYVFPDGSAVQRRNGFIVEAPEVKELYQLFPQYHISMNFEDINYYVYEEDSDGQEIYGESAILKIATSATGGLIWEEGTESEISGEGSQFTLQDTIDGNGISNVQLKGDTTQQTYTGKNMYDFSSLTLYSNAGITSTSNGFKVTISSSNSTLPTYYSPSVSSPIGTFTISFEARLNNPSTASLVFATTNPYIWGIRGGLKNSSGQQVTEADRTLTSEWKRFCYTVTTTSSVTWNAGYAIHLYFTTYTNSPELETQNWQIEQNSTLTAYEPYVGRIPAPNPSYPQAVNTVTGRQVVTITDGGSQSQEYEVNLGKNLLDPSILIQGDITGGTSTDRVCTRSGDDIYVSGGDTYTISVSDIAIQVNVYAYKSINGTAIYESGWQSMPFTFELPSQANYLRLMFRYSNDSDIVPSDITCQLEKGSTATSYAPYISHFGKNMFDGEFEQGTYDSSGNKKTSSTQYRNIKPIAVTGGSSYCFSATGISAYDLFTYDENMNFIAYGYTTGTYTFSATVAYVNFSVTTGSAPTNMQIEAGSTATPYQQFIGGQLELCKIGTYQDYIYKSGDDWYVHKAINSFVANGSEEWSKGDSSGRMELNVADAMLGSASNNPILSNRYIQRFEIADGSIFLSGVKHCICIIDQVNGTNAGNYKTWLGSNPTTIYYVLATATDTQITNAGLISQLNALAGATTYDGQTAFTVTSENQLGILSLSSLVIAGGGVVWDNYGAEWEEGTGGGPTMISVDSIDNVYPVWELKGPAVNPQISVLTTNTTLTYTGSITASQTLSIDMFNKTATLNGTSVIGNVSGDWVYLKPGINRVTYTTNNADAPDSTIWWQEIVG